MATGAELIAAERRRQVEGEGWTAAHDAAHGKGEIALAAVSYAREAGRWPKDFRESDPTGPACPFSWPWEPDWWKPTGDAVGDLIKAGALIAAEIDRLQDAAASEAMAPQRPPVIPPTCAVCAERPPTRRCSSGEWFCDPCAIELEIELAAASSPKTEGGDGE